MRISAALVAALALASTTCSSSGGSESCTVTFPSGGITACNVAFACDSGDYTLSCSLSGTSFMCQCSSGVSFPVSPFPCNNAEQAIEVANAQCQLGVTLSE